MTSSELKHIGPRIKLARANAGLTLEELAEELNLSVSTISRLESGKRQASLELILPIARRLNLDLNELVFAKNSDPRVKQNQIHRGNVAITSLTPSGSQLGVFKIRYPGELKKPEPRTHEGNDWVYVLWGNLRLVIGDQEHILQAGEAAQFDTTVPHSMSSGDGKPVETLNIFGKEGLKLHSLE